MGIIWLFDLSLTYSKRETTLNLLWHWFIFSLNGPAKLLDWILSISSLPATPRKRESDVTFQLGSIPFEQNAEKISFGMSIVYWWATCYCDPEK